MSAYCAAAGFTLSGARIERQSRTSRSFTARYADVAFVLGGVHAPGRLADYRRAVPGENQEVKTELRFQGTSIDKCIEEQTED